MRYLVVVVLVNLCLEASLMADSYDLAQLKAERRALVDKPRALIADNDGCDVLYYPTNKPYTVENFLQMRSVGEVAKHAAAISYCTISSGFSFFTHESKVATLLARQGRDYGILPHTRNVAAEMIEHGSDCLRVIVDHAHKNSMECFWSMRMNDTHDAAHNPKKPYFLFPPLKEEHPEWLVGKFDARPPHGQWSSVNYAVPQIRELAYRYIEEVCRNYQVDGIELDFFRHLCYFKSVADGGKATAEELEAMTGLIRRIRQMTERVGIERKRPILVLVRLPDSLEYCKDSGLDLESWLKEGLLDILITTGYFRLNPWEYTVNLGRKYGVKVYPSIDECRVKGETRFKRNAVQGYHARAARALAAGMDGIYSFNYFNPNSPLWQAYGDPKHLALSDKYYFVTGRGNVGYGDPSRWLANGAKYSTTQILTPERPVTLKSGDKFSAQLLVYEDFTVAATAGVQPSIALCLNLPEIKNADLFEVTLNGKKLSNGKVVEAWLDFPLQSADLINGDNRVEILYQVATAGEATATQKLSDVVLNVAYRRGQ